MSKSELTLEYLMQEYDRLYAERDRQYKESAEYRAHMARIKAAKEARERAERFAQELIEKANRQMRGSRPQTRLAKDNVIHVKFS